MTNLDAEKTQRYRRQLLAAVFARYFWIGLSLALLHYFSLPFRNELTIAGGVLGAFNTLALFSFWHLKFDHAMVYCMVTGDNLVLLYAVAATGLFASPFSIVLIVVAALTVLVADLRFGTDIGNSVCRRLRSTGNFRTPGQIAGRVEHSSV